jgi:hypothetical protein
MQGEKGEEVALIKTIREQDIFTPQETSDTKQSPQETILHVFFPFL